MDAGIAKKRKLDMNENNDKVWQPVYLSVKCV